jgi:hypothetical protein
VPGAAPAKSERPGCEAQCGGNGPRQAWGHTLVLRAAGGQPVRGSDGGGILPGRVASALARDASPEDRRTGCHAFGVWPPLLRLDQTRVNEL